MHRTWLSTALLVASFVPTVCSAQGGTLRWQDYDQPGYQATRQRGYETMELVLTNRLEKLNQATTPDNQAVLTYLERLIRVLCLERKYKTAEEYCTLAIRFGQRLNLDAKHAATLKTTLAKVYLKQGKLSQAEVVYKQALELLDKESACPEKTKVLVGLAETLTAENKLCQADLLFRKAFPVNKNVLQVDDPADLSAFAQCLIKEGRLEEASQLLREVLQADLSHLGEGQPPPAADYNNLAYVLSKLEKHDQAEANMKEALALCRQFHYADLPDWLDNLACIFERAGKTDAAAATRKEAETLRNPSLSSKRTVVK